MTKKSTFILSLLITLCSCTINNKQTSWIPVNNSETVICNIGEKTSPMLFISSLNEIIYKTKIAPDSIISISATPKSSNSFIISKRIRRHIDSMNDYVTLSSLQVYIEFKMKNKMLIIKPVKKMEHQVSIIGSWPIPKMEMSELVSFLGTNCLIKK